jgi:hypothetical protein
MTTSDADICVAEFLSGTIKGVHHVALLTEDLEASLEFYVGVLGAVSSLAVLTGAQTTGAISCNEVKLRPYLRVRIPVAQQSTFERLPTELLPFDTDLRVFMVTNTWNALIHSEKVAALRSHTMLVVCALKQVAD